MNSTPSNKKYLVTATPPTTNGDLHVGHLSGPYLAADVFGRAQKLQGHEVLYLSGGDDHQTYVVTRAEKLGVTPHSLAARCNEEIRSTLQAGDIGIDSFNAPDAPYIEAVQAFFSTLEQRAIIRDKTVVFPYSKKQERYLFEAYVSGICPECYSSTAGAICETCGHPNDANTLMFPSFGSAVDEQDIEYRSLTIKVLPLEDYRADILAFYQQHNTIMRPHLRAFVDEMMSRPLEDFPVTYPSHWGIRAPFPGCEDQVLNVWAEMLPGLIHMTNTTSPDSPWRPDSGYQLVQFMGFDNSYYFSLVHLAMQLAQGDLVTPTAIITNEFFHLENQKFSTSRGHLIWAADLLKDYGADNVRFFLALANPETQTANFSEKEFIEAIQQKLHTPLGQIAEAIARQSPGEMDVSELHVHFLRYAERMTRLYSLETFCLRQAAETTVQLLRLLSEKAHQAPIDDRQLAFVSLGLCYISHYAAPLMPAFCERLKQVLMVRTSAPGQAVPQAIQRLAIEKLNPALLLAPLKKQENRCQALPAYGRDKSTATLQNARAADLLPG
ncbi:class I tRNA ligase family protein [Pseudomonas sp. UV AK001]|uniref:class I tRNA ligase family protein n=1 Tax=Pseudomonas sp. UV AK001 TaxID=3384791 RepID=UPI0038D3CCCA